MAPRKWGTPPYTFPLFLIYNERKLKAWISEIVNFDSCENLQNSLQRQGIRFVLSFCLCCCLFYLCLMLFCLFDLVLFSLFYLLFWFALCFLLCFVFIVFFCCFLSFYLFLIMLCLLCFVCVLFLLIDNLRSRIGSSSLGL